MNLTASTRSKIPALTVDDYAASNFNVAAVPEPESYALFLGGLGCAIFIARRLRH